MNYEILYVLFVLWMYFRYFGPIIIFFKKERQTAKKPQRFYGKAACWDVYAAESKVIPIGQWREVSLGISIAPAPHIYIPFLNITFTPFGNVAYKIHTRSGLAIKKGLRNHLGIIDNDYRNELSVVVYNHGTYPVVLNEGDRVAQIEFYRVPSVWMFQRKKLSNSHRGKSGFGSSGK